MTSASDIAFTPTVKALQEARGSRSSYARMEERGGFRTAITDDLATFVANGCAASSNRSSHVSNRLDDML